MRIEDVRIGMKENELRAARDRGMAAWVFEPPAQGNGGVSTPVRVTLAARALSANAFQVRLDNVSFPLRNKDAARIVIQNMRSKPEVQLWYRATGIVTVELSVGADGRLQ